jgi:hypothetical protein
MEKVIKVGEYEFAAKSTAASLFSYKANFNRDAIRDLISLAKSMPQKQGDVEAFANDGFDLDVLFRFLWVFAKAADKSIQPLETWLEGFDMPPFDFAVEVLPQVQDMLTSTVKSSVKSKN